MSDSVVAAHDVGESSAVRHLCYSIPHFAERYEGWEEIGMSGNNTAVVKVTSQLEKAPVALKILLNMHSDMRDRFAREARTSRSVVSPYVVRTASAFVCGAVSWLEMEWVDGTDLDHELARREREAEPYSVGEALDIALAVCRGLAAAHAVKVLHRDIKPANILLPRSGTPVAKLTDFGIAKTPESPNLTRTDTFIGTPLYCSPEGLAGERALTLAHDIWGVGQCLFALFTTHRYPFDIDVKRATTREIARAVIGKRAQPLRAERRDVPESIEALVAHCLEKDPEARPSAAALVAEIERIITTLNPPAPHRPETKWWPRKVLLIALGVAASGVLALVALLALFLWLARAPEPKPPAINELATTTTPMVALPAAPTALPESVATIRIESGFVTVAAGARRLSGELEVIAGSGHHTHKIQKMEPGDLAWVSLAELTPPLPATEKVREVRLTVSENGRPVTYSTTP